MCEIMIVCEYLKASHFKCSSQDVQLNTLCKILLNIEIESESDQFPPTFDQMKMRPPK